MLSIITIVAGYLLGSISFSYLFGKWFKGIDIRKHGSGNAGATNTLRVLGKGPAILVLLLDALKGVAAVWIGTWAAPGPDAECRYRQPAGHRAGPATHHRGLHDHETGRH